MFTAALFTITKTWKQPKSPSTEKQIKMWYIYIQQNITQPLKKYEKYEIMPLAATWRDLEIIIISKPNKEREIPYDISLIYRI